MRCECGVYSVWRVPEERLRKKSPLYSAATRVTGQRRRMSRPPPAGSRQRRAGARPAGPRHLRDRSWSLSSSPRCNLASSSPRLTPHTVNILAYPHTGDGRTAGVQRRLSYMALTRLVMMSSLPLPSPSYKTSHPHKSLKKSY